jgi:exodeoxyribonuclease VII large subunit
LKPASVLAQRRERLQAWQRRLHEQCRHGLLQRRNLLAHLQSRLRLLGPENVLARGYSITSDAATGQVLRAANEAKPGQRLKTRLKSGEVRSVVEKPNDGV